MAALVGAFNFTVRLIETAKPGSAIIATLAPSAQGGFSECTGLEATMQVEEYREGGRNDGVLRFPGRVGHANLRLRRGAALSPDLWRWHESFLRGRGKRRDGVIELRDDTGETLRTWRFKRGLPVRWVGPALVAGQSTVAIEELEIAHEGLTVNALGAVGEIASTIGAIAGAPGG
jgi:phage tail-like protein